MRNGSTNDWETGQDTLSTSAALVLDRRAHRVRVTIKNIDTSIVVYIGDSSAVSSSNGFPLAAGESVSLYTSAEVYAVSASGTPTIAYVVEQQI